MNSRTLGAIIAGASATITACGKNGGPPKTPPVPVAVTRVIRSSVPYTITADGTVEPLQTAQVQAQVGGILTDVTFREGQDVTEGQVLFRIDPRPYKAALDQATANLARDQATYSNAKTEAARYQTLVAKDYVTKEQADQEMATMQSAAAALEGDSAAVEVAKLNLDWATIRAPISGRAGAILVRKGNLVRGGTQQALVLINQIHPILVHFAVPATSLPAIQMYASKGSLPVSVVPGMPPNATAQSVSNGPTPAYTTDAPSDAPAGEPVLSGGGDSTITGRTGGHGGGAGRHRRDSTASSDGPPSGPPTGTPGASGSRGYVSGGGLTSGATADPASPAGGTNAGAAPSTPGGSPGGAAGGQGGGQYQRRRDSTGGGSAGVGRGGATMPGLPGVATPGREMGTLTFIDNQVDTTTGTVQLKASFPNVANNLWPGQFVATTVRLFVEENALVVPAQAVMTGQQGTYVYLVDAAGTARQQPVGVERTSANRAVIISGLTEGEQVVTDGQSRLTPGAKVNIRGLVPAGNGGTPAGGANGSG